MNWTEVDVNKLSEVVIGAAIDVHKHTGPGLLESAYEHCLAHEFMLRGIPFERQKAIPVVYKNTRLDCGYRLDFLVAKRLIVELKSVEKLHPIHDAQVITYLKLTGLNLALLFNFNVHRLKLGGIKRKVLNL